MQAAGLRRKRASGKTIGKSLGSLGFHASHEQIDPIRPGSAQRCRRIILALARAQQSQTGSIFRHWNARANAFTKALSTRGRGAHSAPSASPAEDPAFMFIGSKAFTGAEGQLRNKNGLLSGDVDGDRIADFQLGKH